MPEQRITVNNCAAQRIGLGNSYEIVEGETYYGDYMVNPDFIGRTLYTNGKLMIDNVMVEPIEVHRTSNPQGGKTVYIGGLLDG